MFCKKCGAHLKDFARFCDKCGAAVKEAEAADTHQEKVEHLKVGVSAAEDIKAQVLDVQPEVAQTKYPKADPNAQTMELNLNFHKPEPVAQNDNLQYTTPLYNKNLQYTTPLDMGAQYQGEDTPVKTKSLLRTFAVVLLVIAMLFQLAGAALFSVMPVYNVAIEINADSKSYKEDIERFLGNEGAATDVSKDMTAFELTDNKLKGFGFLNVDTDDLYTYVAIGLIAFCVLTALLLIIPMVMKKLYTPLCLVAVLSQGTLIVGSVLLMLFMGNVVKDAMDDFLVNFAQLLVFDEYVAIEGASSVLYSVSGYLFIGVMGLAVITTVIAMVVGALSVKKAKTLAE